MRPRSDPGQRPDALISSARLRIASRSIFLRAWYGFGRMSLMGTTTFMRTPPPMPQLFSSECLVRFYHTGARAVKQWRLRATNARRPIFAASRAEKNSARAQIAALALDTNRRGAARRLAAPARRGGQRFASRASALQRI